MFRVVADTAIVQQVSQMKRCGDKAHFLSTPEIQNLRDFFSIFIRTFVHSGKTTLHFTPETYQIAKNTYPLRRSLRCGLASWKNNPYIELSVKRRKRGSSDEEENCRTRHYIPIFKISEISHNSRNSY